MRLFTIRDIDVHTPDLLPLKATVFPSDILPTQKAVNPCHVQFIQMSQLETWENKI